MPGHHDTFGGASTASISAVGALTPIKFEATYFVSPASLASDDGY